MSLKWKFTLLMLFGMAIITSVPEGWWWAIWWLGLYVTVIGFLIAAMHRGRYGHWPDHLCQMHVDNNGETACFKKEDAHELR